MRKERNEYLIHFIREVYSKFDTKLAYIIEDWSLDIILQEKSTGDVFFIQEFEYDLYDKLLEYRKIGNEIEDDLIYRKEKQRIIDEQEKEYLSKLINNVLYGQIQHYNTCKIESLSDLDNVILNEGVRNIIKQKIRDFKLTKLL